MTPEESGLDWPTVTISLGVAIPAIILIGVLAYQALKTWQSRIASRAEIARDDAYRKLAEQSTATQQQLSEDTACLRDDVGDLRERVASIEKMLREVE